MADYRIKKITLPSGKVVEIVYLRPGTPEYDEAVSEPEVHVRRIELCPSCSGSRVHPVDWREVDDCRWELRVRCPDCRWRATGVFEGYEVERYDEVLAAEADLLIEELAQVTRQNMADQLERFRLALENDAIHPMDF